MSRIKLLEVDSRKRITLGRLAEHDLYLADVLPNGSILLTPAEVTLKDKS